ncbi:hypothetical protein P152DRAFT_476108 [Eremomyces bilateralis CBS 781.70]|uniref:Uncharacterized protein n=1 Tax=Eremomyces bilateralis CBS 781.70 TaxID=1392243 RepID=A0A6G1FW33_9PEZI|nr:uncharacterized protein P152DRAFT_476108 [Eremomyces bilateralis CBS 781.70]KAF1809983.1 hypothetical protein P152DRAFT_476108 [Eremomyces bilateralis CBS 781.70]
MRSRRDAGRDDPEQSPTSRRQKRGREDDEDDEEEVAAGAPPSDRPIKRREHVNLLNESDRLCVACDGRYHDVRWVACDHPKPRHHVADGDTWFHQKCGLFGGQSVPKGEDNTCCCPVCTRWRERVRGWGWWERDALARKMRMARPGAVLLRGVVDEGRL